MGRESEDFLARLCRKSFLSLWSYPNPFTDRGLAGRKEGKELCDLLVIYGDDVIIFSDKSCAYPACGDPHLDWRRWYRRAVGNSCEQIFGAERWIRRYPNRIYADNRCTRPLTTPLPPPDRLRIHRIVVALGAKQRCQEHFGGGSGSLPISGGGHDVDATGEREPFYLGDDGQPGSFVHVLDDVALELVLRELDTVADFTQYLRKKEDLFESLPVIAAGEEDLLAHYLFTVDGPNGHVFIPGLDGYDGVFVEEGKFQALLELPQYHNSKQVNRVSYVWDRIIEHFTETWRQGRMENAVSGEDLEVALRLMASPDRVFRRRLGQMVVDSLDTSPGHVRYVSVAAEEGADIAFACVCAGRPEGIDEDTYRRTRQSLMLQYARSLKVRLPHLSRVLVLGVEPRGHQGATEDLAVVDLTEWSPELEQTAVADMKRLGLGSDPRRFREFEYPLRVRHPESKAAARRRRQMERNRRSRPGDEGH